MKNVPENELFSAYLDGEVTDAERAEVEQLLAADPAARQLLDELRALRGTLQALPRHELAEDLSARVLREAERLMLTEAAAPRPATRGPAADRFAWWSFLRQRIHRRALIWSGLALAAGLLLMLNDPSRLHKPQAQLAQAPQAGEAPREIPELRAAPAAPAQPDRRPDAARSVAGASAGTPLAEMPHPAPAAPAPPTLEASSPAMPASVVPAHAGPEELKVKTESPSGRSAGGARESSAPSPAAVAVRSGESTERSPNTIGSYTSATASFAAKKGTPGDNPLKSKAGPLKSKAGLAKSKEALRAELKSGPGGESETPGETTAWARQLIDKGILVVECYTSHKDAGQGQIEKLLAGQQISQSQHSLRTAEMDALLAADKKAQRQPPTLVYAEGTPLQIETVLGQLRAEPQFFAVNVEPAPGATGQPGAEPPAKRPAQAPSRAAPPRAEIQTPAETSSALNAPQRSTAPRSGASAQQTPQPLETAPKAQNRPQPLYRVLFVLHVASTGEMSKVAVPAGNHPVASAKAAAAPAAAAPAAAAPAKP